MLIDHWSTPWRFRPAGILKQRAANADQIGFALLKQGFGSMNVRDASRQDHRQTDRRLDCRGQLAEITLFTQARTDIAADAARNIEQVNPRLPKQPSCRRAIRRRTAAVHVIACAQPKRYQIIRSYCFSHRLDDL